MARSVKKGPFVDEHLMVKIAGMNERSEKKVVKTWSRRSTIVPDMIGHPISTPAMYSSDIRLRQTTHND